MEVDNTEAIIPRYPMTGRVIDTSVNNFSADQIAMTRQE
jgi:hypothetical protein|tara:strand:+ start:187 stop:303 length:117 start_codon:yes stop_codon:yes gene_type:complete